MFFNAPLKVVDEWWATAVVSGELIVCADPEADLYEALETRRKNPLALAANSAAGALRSARQGLLPKLTRTDMLRLGADVAIRADGSIALLHRAEGADDRVPIEQLLRSLAPS